MCNFLLFAPIAMAPSISTKEKLAALVFFKRAGVSVPSSVEDAINEEEKEEHKLDD